MKKLLFFIICLMLPIFICADSGVDYDDAVHYTNNYIYSFDKYNSYLFFKDKLEYVYEDGVFSYNPNFKSGGMLSKTEYEISNRDGRTFLSNGLEFWTLSKSSGGRHFVLNYRLQENDDSLKSGVRVTEYVKHNSIVSGRGSYADPWQFSEVLNLHLNSTNIIRGKVSTVPCSDTSMQKETVTLSFTSGSRVDAYICPASGYTVFSNSCSGYMTKDLNNKYVVSGVSKDNLICNIKFTYSTNAVTLGCNNCNTAPSPSKIYSNKVHDLWFNNKNGLDENKITKITTVPFKTGYTFKGFYKDGMLVIDTSGKLMDDSTSVITSDTTINASFDANKYVVNFEVEDSTDDEHTTDEEVIFDSTPQNIIVPRRAYTVKYNANGGTVDRTQDIVAHTFDGYFYNGVQYYDTNGYSAQSWNIAENVTLTGRWSGGTVNFPNATRPGYKLLGWYDTGGNKVENRTVITKNLNLTARWEAIDVNYKVKHYKENIDGSYASPEIETFSAKTATTVKPSVKSYTGFVSPSVQSAVVDGSGTTVIEYRYLRNKYTVTIGVNNTSYGSINTSSLTIKHGTTYSVSGNVLTFSDGQKVTATATAKTGYTTKFGSWSSTSGTVKGAASISASFSRTANQYSIIYNCNGGTPTTAYSSNHTYDLSANLTANKCSRSGFSYQGWNTAANGSGTNYSNEQVVSNLKSANNDSINLYAKWKDVSNPSCKLKATSSGVTFESKTDNVGVTSFGLIKSTTATYNGTSTLALSNGTFYGYVKDAAGNTGKCQITIGGTYVSSYTKTTQKCNRSVGSYDKTVQTCVGTFSHYSKTTKKCNATFTNYSKVTETCDATSVKSYKKVSKTCTKTTVYAKKTQTCSSTGKYSGTCCCRSTMYSACVNLSVSGYSSSSCSSYCTGKGYTTGLNTLSVGYAWNSGSTLANQTSCTASTQSCSSSSHSGNKKITCTSSLKYGWSTETTSYPSTCTANNIICGASTAGQGHVTCSVYSYNYAWGSTKSSLTSSCTASTPSCSSSSHSGNVKVSCTKNYSYSFGSESTTTASSCSNNKISCGSSTSGQTYVSCSAKYNYNMSESVLKNQSSCTTSGSFTCGSSTEGQTYVSNCKTNYNYGFGASNSTVNSCSTTDSFTCGSGTYGSSYVSACTPVAYACSDSGYTKVTDSYCYKY